MWVLKCVIQSCILSASMKTFKWECHNLLIIFITDWTWECSRIVCNPYYLHPRLNFLKTKSFLYAYTCKQSVLSLWLSWPSSTSDLDICELHPSSNPDSESLSLFWRANAASSGFRNLDQRNGRTAWNK